ncbi:hypothetical protein BJ085DRAFT_19959 [Dimargaris cristalligena]|uniref:Uncharacterized protein n=1 Tax=Dimargaris cristalligena TaxID=215637 RepID=A0A4P9ZUN7_9FUNG|nr:hypothetical protein BJ085DRAFT_19959 [Dimargaris cristalligena]|eukprot:RKP37267.1 hypothetical protein BJ085DRAFT_19959 [Dimargaris cristalligena]
MRSLRPFTLLQLLSPRAAQSQRYALRSLSTNKFGENGGGWVDPEPQSGGYPNLPHTHAGEKSPFGWDNMQDRRNFGDTVQEQDEILGAWGPTLYPGDTKTALRDWACFIFGIGLVSTLAYATYPEPHFERRSYPYDGLRLELGGDPNNPDDRRLAVSHSFIYPSQ